jgi:hypothetical protein
MEAMDAGRTAVGWRGVPPPAVAPASAAVAGATLRGHGSAEPDSQSAAADRAGGSGGGGGGRGADAAPLGLPAARKARRLQSTVEARLRRLQLPVAEGGLGSSTHSGLVRGDSMRDRYDTQPPSPAPCTVYARTHVTAYAAARTGEGWLGGGVSAMG